MQGNVQTTHTKQRREETGIEVCGFDLLNAKIIIESRFFKDLKLKLIKSVKKPTEPSQKYSKSLKTQTR